MTFAERIYNGETAEDLQMSVDEYADRKQTLNQFLTGWDKTKPFEQEFLVWLQTVPQGKSGLAKTITSTTSNVKVTCCNSNPEKPTLGTMVASLAAATQAWAKKGFRLVDEEEHQRRLALCRPCEFIYEGGRCRKCGCFMEIKSKLAGMKCPVDKW